MLVIKIVLTVMSSLLGTTSQTIHMPQSHLAVRNAIYLKDLLVAMIMAHLVMPLQVNLPVTTTALTTLLESVQSVIDHLSTQTTSGDLITKMPRATM
jgi:hypothetical protein